MARNRLWRNDVVRSYWRTRHPLLRFLCLHEVVTLPFVVAISDPTTTLAIIRLHFGDCLSGTLFSSRWSAMEFRRCIPPCMRFIAREDPHSKCILCLGFSHAREAVYGTSKCKTCDDFRLITLRSRLEDYERESSIFPRCASSTSAAPREIAASRRAASWGSDVELEEMESEQTGLAFSLPPSPERARANSPVEFLPDFLFPSPKARDFVSFGLDDVLHTAASDSEDFGPVLADALPPSGQEARPSAAYSELVDVLSRATEKLALDWPDEPRESWASKLDDRFLIGAHSKLERRKLPFFSDLHREISSSWKQSFSSRLTNAAAADFTNLVGSVEQGYTTMPVIEDTLASHLSPSLAPSWKSRPRCWRWEPSCLRSRKEIGLSPSTWRMRIFTSRSFTDTGDSFGSPLEGRLTNTRSCPSAWLWLRGHLPNAWMLHWPLWGYRAFVYWTIWMTGSFWLTPRS